VNEGVNDLIPKLYESVYGDEEKKAIAKKKYVEEIFPAAIKNFNALLEKNGNNGPFVGNKYSYADFAVYFGIGQSQKLPGIEEIVNSYPHVKAFYERIDSLEAIKKHIETRGY